MKANKSLLLQAFLFVGVGLVIGLLVNPTHNAANTSAITPVKKTVTAKTEKPATTSESEQISNINQLLTSEIEAREELQNMLTKLQTEFDAFRSAVNSAAIDSPERQKRIVSTQQSRLAMTQDRSWFNETALLEVGIDEMEARRLREIYEQNEMDRLYLRDQAIREGWLGSSRYVKEMDTLNKQISALQEDLDEQTYDAYLYASGKPNRVVINGTLSNSPAAKAGLVAGDVILKYDNKRIYTAGKLREMTTQGESNSVVSVEVIRNGKLITLYLPIGPLGIRMNSRSVAPYSQ